MENLVTFLLLAILAVTLLNAVAIFFLWVDVRNAREVMTPPLFGSGQQKETGVADKSPPAKNMWYGVDPPTWHGTETTTTTVKLPDEYYEDVTVTMDGKAATITTKKKAAKAPAKPTRKKAAKP